MALPPPPIEPLTPDEVAQIPSPSLPIGLQISHLVAEFTRLTIQLFGVISTTSPSLAAAGSSSSAGGGGGGASSSPTEAIFEALSAVDEKLAALLVMYDAHQRRQRHISSLIHELGTLDSKWRSSALTLEECISSLSPIVQSGALDRKAISLAQEAHLNPDTLLSYARLLAPFTSAPPASLFPPEVKLKGVGATDPTGRTLPAGAIPPFPTEATMRRGRLQFGREGLLQGYLGETEEVGGRRDSITGALIPPDHNAPSANANAAAANGHKPADTAARLEHEAKAHADGQDGEAAGTDDFVFDLDLNPDL
ncbi:hypothetical protein JCM10908_001072 [Rhodotorula pacifica]|uniref:Med4p n=1 Tax=Rhodotorula pacifica TaxID=1495444 RepID=UPI0031718514